MVLPGSTSSSSTSSSVPTSTRYCFPPVSMTAYMDPQGFVDDGGRRAWRSGCRTWGGARHRPRRGRWSVRPNGRTGQSSRGSPASPSSASARSSSRSRRSRTMAADLERDTPSRSPSARDHLLRPARAELRVEPGPGSERPAAGPDHRPRACSAADAGRRRRSRRPSRRSRGIRGALVELGPRRGAQCRQRRAGLRVRSGSRPRRHARPTAGPPATRRQRSTRRQPAGTGGSSASRTRHDRPALGQDHVDELAPRRPCRRGAAHRTTAAASARRSVR